MLFNPFLIKSGLAKVLQRLISNLKLLEDEGIEVVREDAVYNLKGSLAIINLFNY